MIVRIAAVIALIALVAGSAGAQNAPAHDASPAPAASYMPVVIPSNVPTTPPAPASGVTATPTALPLATPQPKPPPNLFSYTGQLLDVRGDFVYFTSGDAFAAVDPLRVVSYETGQPTTIPPQTKMFAKATFDPNSHKIIELAITTKRLPFSDEGSALIGYRIEKSDKTAAPEIIGIPISGKQVAVVFEVTVPVTTSITDEVFISTDASGWNPQAIRLDRVDAYKYRAVRYFASGTRFAYRVDRGGSFTSVEEGEDGLIAAPHLFFVREVDSLAARVTVYHWSDSNPAAPQAGPNSLPTPYNSNPFGGGPGGIAIPQFPTPQPTRFP